ncbi:MAG: DNA recombination protein RmuC [Saprospirales bacterium]|nr:DNA recombination protein RmuC [Saprospirales bacterium]MBK8922878.1 DNA recombination protein RmuC [Saprospirales bacterium]
MDASSFLLFGAISLVVFVLVLLRRRSDGVFPEDHTVHALRAQLAVKEQEIRDYLAQLAARDQTIVHLRESMEAQKKESEALGQRFKTEFENLANRLLEEKSRQFTEHNAQQLHQTLAPLREKILEFEQNIDRKFMEETREKASLKKEIENLRELNHQLSRDAHNLTSALKGQSKMQGDWGEFQLEVLLEKAGLQKGAHFLTQTTFRDDEGVAKRPDFIIHLPENKHLVIDAKVSLTAFERFFNEDDPVRREQHLRAHVGSIRNHVQELSAKNYQMLYQINTPDYLLLFIPLENALTVAAQADPKLFTDALERNIVLVTTSSLLATMRTVAHLWKQEKQSRSVLEIARQSGLLYDRFVSFVDDLRNIGVRLDAAKGAFDDAMVKLVNGARPGDTLIGRAEKIRELGAKATKRLPPGLVEEANETPDEIMDK